MNLGYFFYCRFATPRPHTVLLKQCTGHVLKLDYSYVATLWYYHLLYCAHQQNFYYGKFGKVGFVLGEGKWAPRNKGIDRPGIKSLLKLGVCSVFSTAGTFIFAFHLTRCAYMRSVLSRPQITKSQSKIRANFAQDSPTLCQAAHFLTLFETFAYFSTHG